MEDNNKTSLFRQKNIDRIDSPEVLDHYLSVTSPGVWAVLSAIIVLLIGVIIWCALGRIDSTIDVAIVSEERGVFALVPESGLEAAIDNRVITLKDTELELAPQTIEPVVITSDTNIYVIKAGHLAIGDIVYPLPVSADLDEGIYTGTILVETISPIKLLFN